MILEEKEPPERTKVIFYRLNPAFTAYNLRVRRFVPILACFAFALSLHASIPGNSAARLERSGNLDRPIRASEPLPLTAFPADRQSFYAEFYDSEQLPARTERKAGLLHRVVSAFKKTAQKVNLIPNLIPN